MTQGIAHKKKSALSCTFAVIDFETTGSVAGWPIEPWQVGIVSLENGRVQPATQFESLLHVGERPFNPMAPGRHAQLRDALKAAPSPQLLWPELAARLCNCPLVAHNIGTERGVLNKIAPMHNLGPWVDTLKLTRRHYPALGNKALENVVVALNLTEQVQKICPERGAHDALYDAVACAVLLEHFLNLPGWENVTLGALM